MNLIPCAHPCVHQTDGYCTLQNLRDAVCSAQNDCIYFRTRSAEEPPEVPHRTDPDQLQSGISGQADSLDIMGRQNHLPES